MKAWNKARKYVMISFSIGCITACGKVDIEQSEYNATSETQAEGTQIQAGETDEELSIREKIQEKIKEQKKAEEQDAITADRDEQVAEEREESEDIEKTQQKYIYKGNSVLNEDNIEKVMKSFLQINDSCFFARLETLPLTEKFFYECIEHPGNFPYVEDDDVEKMEQFKLIFWGIREDGKCVCLCEFIRAGLSYVPEGSFYYVVMDLENEQIDSIEVTLVKKYTP